MRSCGCCCAMIIGIVLFFIGIGMIAYGSTHSREQKFTAYSNQIDLWQNGGKKQQFEYLEFGIKQEISNTHIQFQNKFFQKVSLPGRVKQQKSHKDLPGYEDIKYQLLKEGKEVGIETQNKYNPNKYLNYTLSIRDSRFPNLNNQVNLDKLSLYRQVLQGSKNRQCKYLIKKIAVVDCDAIGGHIIQETNECRAYYVLQQVCVKISKVGETWILNNTWNTFGCLLNQNNQLDVIHYKQFKVEQGSSIDLQMPIQWGKVRITVRSGHDPLLLAQVLTKGTYYFGSESKTLLITGVLLSFCMILCLIRPCIVVCKSMNKGGGCKDLFRSPTTRQDIEKQIARVRRRNLYEVQDDVSDFNN